MPTTFVVVEEALRNLKKIPKEIVPSSRKNEIKNTEINLPAAFFLSVNHYYTSVKTLHHSWADPF